MIEFYMRGKPNEVLIFETLDGLEEWLDQRKPCDPTPEDSTAQAVWDRVEEFNKNGTTPVLFFDPFDMEIKSCSTVCFAYTQAGAEHLYKERYYEV